MSRRTHSAHPGQRLLWRARRQQHPVEKGLQLADEDPLGRLVRFEADGVFGSSKLDFDLNLEGTTILTGANGTGKSTVLRAINAISAADFRSFRDLPLKSVSLFFPKRKRIRMEVTVSGVSVALTGEKPYEWKEKRSKQPMRYVVAEDERRVEFFQDWIVESQALVSGREEHPAWVRQLRHRFPVLYVTDQRLVVETAERSARQRSGVVSVGDPDRVTTRSAVADAARDLAARIERAHSEYGLLSQSIDRDFADRVVDEMESERALSERQLKALIDRVAERRNLLQRIGLLPKDATASTLIQRQFRDRNVRAVVGAVHEDTLQKLAPLEALREPLSLFLDFLNGHYQPRKRVTADPEAGLRVFTEDDVEVPPTKLSSGEQQILVLAHHVLFRAQRGTTVLIDEPELSLHVSWQDTLLDDLDQMARPRDLSFLLATHSPTLIGGRRSLRRSLDFA